jgi:hypothetical protein
VPEERNQDIIDIERKAVYGSLPDIEKVIRFYEECKIGLDDKECERKLEYWIKIGLSFDHAGSMSIRINQISDLGTCESALETLLLIRKLKPKIENSGSKYKYLYSEEEGVAKRKILNLCALDTAAPGKNHPVNAKSL